MRATPVAAWAAVLALFVALTVATAAGAATPCWKTVIADWAADSSIDGHYSASCLQQAMQNAPTDLQIYSTIEQDLQTALRTRSARRLSGVHVSPASLDTTSGSSPLVIVLGGLGVLVGGSAAVASVARRRRRST